jgi:hypothetical protein
MEKIEAVDFDMPDREEGELDLTDDQFDRICEILKELGSAVQRDAIAKLGVDQASALLDELIDMRDTLLEATQAEIHKPSGQAAALSRVEKAASHLRSYLFFVVILFALGLLFFVYS